MEYKELAKKYQDRYIHNSMRFLASIRPKVTNTAEIAKKMEKKCGKASYVEENCVERLLKEIYLGNFNDNLYEFSLPELVAVKKSCESIAKKWGDRRLTKREYKTLSSIAREFNNTENWDVFKKLA